MLIRVVYFAVMAIAIEGLFSVPYLSLELALGGRWIGVLVAVAAAVAALLVVAVSATAARWNQLLRRLGDRAVRIPAAVWLGGLFAVGVLARLAWIAAFPAPLRSDGQTYFQLAQRLVESGVYRDPRGEFAFWPPGYPFFLFVLMKLFGTQTWVPIAGNLILLAASLLGVHLLATRLLDASAARLATLLMALWPNLVFTSGTGSKELLIAAMLPFALLLYLGAADSGAGPRGWWRAAVAGGILGLATLAQPAMFLFPSALAGFEWLRSSPVRAATSRCLIAVLVIAATVGLWTYRNYRTFGTFVLVSTNGGPTFYRAANPLATGGYTEAGERGFAGMNEVERHQRGTAWAIEWIRSHPVDFAKLAIRKQVLFLGDDGVGAYETLKRGLEISDRRYVAAKLVSNLFWLALLAALLAAFLPTRLPAPSEHRAIALLGLAVGYFWVIDSIFESGGRHHVPAAGAIAILAVLKARARD